MHGDEPTATLALVDLIRYVVENRDDPLVQRLSERLTVVMLPDHVNALGPEGGGGGGRVNATGTPEEVAKVGESYTGKFLRDIVGG
jgi:excinuclease ABC subunit A